MAASVQRALAAQKMTIREIALKWAPELDCDGPTLEKALYLAIVDGEFDALPDGHGALNCDHATGMNGSTTSALVRLRIAKSGNAAIFAHVALAEEAFALHTDAALAFAHKRGLMPPSWWAPETPAPPQKPNVSPAALDAFLNQNADGQLTEADLLKRAEVYFDSKIIRREVWRTAFARVPQNQKRRRGVARGARAPT